MFVQKTHLKGIKKTPPNGLALFCGNVAKAEGQSDLPEYNEGPCEGLGHLCFYPLPPQAYWCIEAGIKCAADHVTVYLWDYAIENYYPMAGEVDIASVIITQLKDYDATRRAIKKWVKNQNRF